VIKLVFISDIHRLSPTDKHFRDILPRIVDVKPDVVILGGDIADYQNGFEHTLRDFRKRLPEIPIGVVAGNHDLYFRYWRRRGKNLPNVSDLAFYKWMPEICKNYNCNWMETDPIVKDSWLFLGTIAWYDYSGKDLNVPLPDEYYEQNKDSYTWDGDRTSLSKNDVDFASECLTNLVRRVDENDSPSIENLAFFTHVPLFRSARNERVTDLSVAYYQNITIGDYVLSLPKARLVVSGHSHIGKDTIERSEKVELRHLVSYWDYQKLEFFDIDLQDDNITYCRRKGWKTSS
jgi:hypothetical protein